MFQIPILTKAKYEPSFIFAQKWLPFMAAYIRLTSATLSKNRKADMR